MSRILDGIIQGTQGYTGSEVDNAQTNLIYGGQFGHHHRAGYLGEDGRHYEEWINNAAYVKQDIIPVLLSYPKGFDYMPNPDLMIGTLKSLIEVRSKTIDGFNSKLTVNVNDQQIGRAGSEVQSDPIGVKREASTVTHSFQEVIGMGVNRYLDAYIRYLISDPDVGLPLVTNLMSDSERPGAWTHDYFTFSALYIEPDVQHYNVINAWLGLGMFPKGTGEWTGKRDIQSDNEVVEHSIEMAGLILPPLEGVREFATSVLRSINILRQDPAKTMVLPVDRIDPSVEKQNTGYDRQF